MNKGKDISIQVVSNGFIVTLSPSAPGYVAAQEETYVFTHQVPLSEWIDEYYTKETTSE